ncbi:MAG: SlyX family protein [Alphaproteobacteria bacterium]|nr:SlyX family protein [Alphaproteobacteria bacterium]
MEDRIKELEMQISHQQKIIDELSDVVFEHSKEILNLKNKTELLKESMNQQLVKDFAEETPPPHY